MFASISATLDLPPGLLEAVCYVESKHTATAFVSNDGGSPSHGMCQIKMPTAQLVGFKGDTKKLMVPKTNIFYSGKYLHHQLVRYHGDVFKAVSAYNAGTARLNKRGLPMNRHYVEKVFAAWKERQ